jgi:hypothetical protein
MFAKILFCISGGSSVWTGWADAHTKISGAPHFKNVIFIQK